MYPYSDYNEHWIVGFLYIRNPECEITEIRQVIEASQLQSPFKNVEFFVQKKYKVAGRTPGSGNTTNIGSISSNQISDFKQGLQGFSSKSAFDNIGGNTKKTMNDFLPKHFDKIIVPPIKCQGIKTKLVKFVSSSVKWSGKGKWIEPFLGSGVVLFNINPDRALIADTNKHIINFYKDIQTDHVNEIIVKDYLEVMGAIFPNTARNFIMRFAINSMLKAVVL